MSIKGRKRTKVIDCVDENGNGYKAKQCFGTLCNGRFKSFDLFHKNKIGLGGRKEICIECDRYKKGSKKRSENILIKKDIDGKKITLKSCTICGEFKDLDQFSNSKDHLYNKYPSCKCCESKRQKNFYKDNKDMINGKHKIYYQENKQTILHRTGSYQANHRDHYLLLQRNWREANQDHIKDYNQNHYAKNKMHYKLVRKRYYQNNKPKFRDWRIKWAEENPELARLYSQRYNAKKKALPYDLSTDELDDIYSQFSYSCALTGKTKNLHHEHFICIDTGHMGTIYGNIIPLEGSLNISKKNKNPFEWIKSFPEYQENFNYIVSILAAINGLNIDEYKQFVYWCYENKRTIEEIKSDKRSSIEIWLSSLN